MLLVNKNYNDVSKYISQYFKVSPTYSILDKNQLPNYIKFEYEIQKVLIENKEYMILSKNTDDFDVSNLSHVQKLIYSLYHLSSLFHFSSLSIAQRKSLLKARIPFVVNNRFLFLPDTFIVIQEQSKRKTAHTSNLTPAAQNVLLLLLVSQITVHSTKDIQESLNVNRMYVSRAISQLLDFNLIHVQNEGVSNSISLMDSPVVTWDLAVKLFSNPILKKVYVSKDSFHNNPDLFLESGLSELSNISNLYEDKKCYAIENRIWLNIEDKFEISYVGDFESVEIEIWKSKIPMYRNKINPLALYFSVFDNRDERIAKEFDNLLNKVLRGNQIW